MLSWRPYLIIIGADWMGTFLVAAGFPNRVSDSILLGVLACFLKACLLFLKIDL